MRRGSFFAVAILAAGLLDNPASAWTPETRMGLSDQAVRFMPESLRLALGRHREDIQRGMLEPMTAEDGPEHRPSWAGGSLEDRIVAEVVKLKAVLAEPTSFSDIAKQFGRVAHFVADAGFPPTVTDGDGAARYAHFSKLCESRRTKFPLVFYGHADRDLARGDYRAWATAVMQRAMAEDRTLSRAYAEAGDPPHPSAFDDRSIPFAVASLSWSHSVTDIVRIWLDAWERAGGDMEDTPYRKQPRK